MDKETKDQHAKGERAAVELADAYYETQQGFIAAWKKAQEFYDSNVNEKGAFKDQDTRWSHNSLLDRVEKYTQQLAHLDNTRKILKEMRLLFPYSVYDEE